MSSMAPQKSSGESLTDSRATSRPRSLGLLRILVGLALPACLGFATPALAQGAEATTTTENPRVLWEEGEALEAQRLFLPALAKYQRSYDLSKNFGLLFVIGRTKEKLPDYVGALAAYEQYAIAEESKAKRDMALARIEALKAAVATVSLSVSSPEVEITIDGRSVGRSPFTKPILLNPGNYEVAGSRPGFVAQRKAVQLSVGERLVLRFDLAPEPVPSATASGFRTQPFPAFPVPKRDTTWMWVGWSTTAALALGAGTLGALSLSANKELSNARGATPASTSNLDSLSSRVKTYSLATDVLMGATVVAAGLSLYLTFRPSSESKTAIQVGPTGVGITGVFR